MNVTIEVLRKRASELGIKNVKQYKKDELIKLVEEKECERKDLEDLKNLSTNKEVLESFLNENPVSILQKNDGEFELHYKDKEALDKAFKSINANEFGFIVAKVDKFLNIISLVKLLSKKKNKTVYKTTIDAPKGEQSRNILQMMKDHPTWSHYKISKIIGCSYTNVYRVWKLWGENKINDQRKRK